MSAPTEYCWKCNTELPDGVHFFCNESCGYEWAIAQACVLQIVKAKARATKRVVRAGGRA